MLLQTQTLIEWLVKNGDEETALEIDGRLPPAVDTEKDRELLSQCGVDVQSLPEQL